MVELGETIDPELNARVRGFERVLADDPPAGLRETAPSYRSLLVLYDPALTDLPSLREDLLARLRVRHEPLAPGPKRSVPVVYGGSDGPDLAAIARTAGLTEAEAASLHAGREYTAYMLGFCPGFAYLGDVDPRLAAPRKATPRLRVAKGSVAIAGLQTGIYPAASAGGWNLIGRTSVRLFDPSQASGALILPGDRVRFEPVRELPGPSPETPEGPRHERPSIEVLQGGLLTTIQDSGRAGQLRLGVSPAGPMDAPAHRAANALVGNTEDSATLECTIAGPTLRFLAPTAFAITGADLGAVLRRSDLGTWAPPLGRRAFARRGNILEFQGRRAGCRAYVAFAGGIDVPKVLGSRSTDLLGAFGGLSGRALRPGDLLGLGREAPLLPEEREWRLPAWPAVALVRVILGPQVHLFDAPAVEQFLNATHTVTTSSDRVGCRLEAAVIPLSGAKETITDGMVFGSIEIPPDGRPIVMMADAPTTGGYPKIATVVRADLPLLAQLVPGEGRVRFEAIDAG
jgi:antagonist of KipI